jgi:hypothetical protein
MPSAVASKLLAYIVPTHPPTPTPSHATCFPARIHNPYLPLFSIVQAIVQGITHLLQPGKAATTAAATTATSASAAAAAKPSSITAAKSPKGSITISLPKLSITPAAATAAAVTTTTKSPVAISVSKLGLRKLLGWGWGASAGPTALQDESEQQIQAAVDGDESVADAAQQSLAGSEILSVPGTAGLADEGIYVSAAQLLLLCVACVLQTLNSVWHTHVAGLLDSIYCV